MQTSVRWGILSTANIGVLKVIPAIQRSKSGTVSALGSRDKQKAESAANALGIEKAYSSYEDLLNDPEIDAIYNPLPNHLHVEWTLKALKAGKHVLCEKPIALDKTEAEYLLNETSKFPNLKVMEAFMYRFHPQWIKTKELISNGIIGSVRTIQSLFSYYNIDPANIRNIPEIGGGGLMDIGCYCISFPRFIFEEEPSAVIGVMDTDATMGTDRMSSGMLKFSEGKTASFTCSTQLFPFQRVHIMGTKGQIIVDIPVNAPIMQETKITVITAAETKEIIFSPVDQYAEQADAFAEAILQDKPVPTPLTDAVANMAAIDAIKLSSQTGKWIEI